MEQVPKDRRDMYWSYWWASLKEWQFYLAPKDRRLRKECTNAFDSAIAICERDGAPDAPLCYLHRGRADLALDEHQYDLALTHAKAAIALNPDDPIAHAQALDATLEIAKHVKKPDLDGLRRALKDFQPYRDKLPGDDRKDADDDIRAAHHLLDHSASNPDH